MNKKNGKTFSVLLVYFFCKKPQRRKEVKRQTNYLILFYIFIIIILDGKSLDGGYVCMPVEDLPHYRLWGYGAVGSAFEWHSKGHEFEPR